MLLNRGRNENNQNLFNNCSFTNSLRLHIKDQLMNYYGNGITGRSAGMTFSFARLGPLSSKQHLLRK